MIIEKDTRIVVNASFYPYHFITERIGKDKIDLRIVIPNGVEPHEYEPSLKQIANIEDSHMLVYNGAGMEPWAKKFINNLKDNNIEIVNGSDYVNLLRGETHEDDEHGNEEEYDPHIWLDPLNMDKIASAIADKLITLDGKNKEYYLENYRELSNQLKNLDLEYSEGLKNRKKDTILVSHSAFGYLTTKHGIEQISVTGITPHSEPGNKTIRRLVDLAKEENFEYIFFEILASPKTVEVLAEEANLKILVLNPLAGLLEEQQKNGEDYFSIMKENLLNLRKALVE